MPNPSVRTRPLTREKLAEFLPSHDHIKAIEDLMNDVAKVLPGAIGGVASDVDTVLTQEAFSRHIPPAPLLVLDPASNILANQIFGG